MILKKEFYFIRHGQTDYNILEGNDKGDHPEDISLNETGKTQAKLIAPTIMSLPIKTICSSPLKRVQETKELISSKLQLNNFKINDLSECSSQIWKEMRTFGMYSPLPKEGIARQFMNRVQNGINEALIFPGPLLVVAHGGIHWSLCCLMGIKNHAWSIDNCIPVHFFLDNDQWQAKKL